MHLLGDGYGVRYKYLQGKIGFLGAFFRVTAVERIGKTISDKIDNFRGIFGWQWNEKGERNKHLLFLEF